MVAERGLSYRRSTERRYIGKMSDSDQEKKVGGGKDHEDAEAHQQIAELKMVKQRGKSAFTRYKNRLYDYLLDSTTDIELIKETLDRVEAEMDSVIEILNRLMTCYTKLGERKNVDKMVEETEKNAGRI